MLIENVDLPQLWNIFNQVSLFQLWNHWLEIKIGGANGTPTAGLHMQSVPVEAKRLRCCYQQDDSTLWHVDETTVELLNCSHFYPKLHQIFLVLLDIQKNNSYCWTVQVKIFHFCNVVLYFAADHHLGAPASPSLLPAPVAQAPRLPRSVRPLRTQRHGGGQLQTRARYQKNSKIPRHFSVSWPINRLSTFTDVVGVLTCL